MDIRTTKKRIGILLILCMLLALTPATAFAAKGQTNARSTSPVSFGALEAAIAGAADKDSAPPSGSGGTHENGTKFLTDDGSMHYGYAWNDVANQYDIEAWNETTPESATRHIKLNADAEGDSTVKKILISNQTVTLDLNGHTIAGSDSYVLGVNTGTTVTVRDTLGNGRITGGEHTVTVINNYGTFHLESGTVHARAQRGLSLSSNATATIAEGAAVESEDASAKGRAVLVNKGCSLTTSGEIRSKYTGIYANGNDSIRIAGGTVEASQYGIYAHNGSVTMTGGTVDAGQYGVFADTRTNFDMSGGRVLSDAIAVDIFYGSIVTVTGGEIIARKALDQANNGTMAIGIWGYQKVDADGHVTGDPPDGKSMLTISGGTVTGPNFGISGNGSVHKKDGYSWGGTIVNITGSAEIHSDGIGIYQPQFGELNISGGTITGGKTGVEVRSGTLHMSGGTVASTATELGGGSNQSGSTVTGAGISVSQHITTQAIDIDIHGGTITGYTSFYEDAFQGNTPEDLAKVNLKITGGQFVSTGIASVISKHETGFITGGSYSHGVDEDYLGTLTWDEAQAFSPSREEPSGFTGAFSCIKGKVRSNDLPYHVGYLTGYPTPMITMHVGETHSSFVPTYKLSNTEIEDVRGNAIVHVSATTDAGGHIAVTYQKGDGSPADTYEESLEPAIAGWTSGAQAVATVNPIGMDDPGVVTAKHVGASPVNITATLFNGEKVDFYVAVAPTVTFEMNGHGAQVHPQYVDYGHTASRPTPAPAETGWTFEGWFTDTTLATAFDFNTPITDDITLYAKWVEAHTVTFAMNGHGIPIDFQTVLHGEKATEPAGPREKGWVFEGWYADEKLTTAFDFKTPITADTTVYAKWDRIVHTVSFIMNGHGAQPAPQTVEDGGTAIQPADPSAEGWTFEGWFADAALTAAFDFNAPITADTIVYAKWTQNVPPPVPLFHTVSFIMNDHGAQPVPQTVEDGGTAIRPADPSAEGWTFEGWFADAALTAAFDFNAPIIADTVIYAKWKETPAATTAPTDSSTPEPSPKPPESTPNPGAALPQTGDDTHVFLWLVLLLVSCVGLAGTLASKQPYK